MNDQPVLKGAFEGIKFGPGKYGEFSAAPTVDPAVKPVLSNKRDVRPLVPISKENRRCMSQLTRITIVALVHMIGGLLLSNLLVS